MQRTEERSFQAEGHISVAVNDKRKQPPGEGKKEERKVPSRLPERGGGSPVPFSMPRQTGPGSISKTVVAYHGTMCF